MTPIAVIDIGTNSIRLAVAKPEPNHHYNTISVFKEVVRLGEGEFTHQRITMPAMERGLLVLRKFVGVARSQGAAEIIVVATAALREAQNRSEFVERAKSECGVDVRVVSGVEEARLIYLGVASGTDLGTNKGLFVDIGGGTTEIIIGDSREYFFLDSLKLGAIRVAEMFPAGDSGKVSKKRYSAMLDNVRSAANHAMRRVTKLGFDQAFGSSGTIINLAEITARRLEENVTSIRNYSIRYADLVETASILCGLTLDQRRNVPGINPERADIIISGAAILQGVMDCAGAECMRISDRGLRDGALIDHLLLEDEDKETYHTTSPRMRSIVGMCRSCRFEESHANKVSDLALSIFEQMSDAGLHSYGEDEMELLRYSALSHDIGTFIGISDHHRHSYYIIRHWELLGFDDEDVEIIASTALCHRKIAPKRAIGTRLGPPAKRLVEVLASIIRVADALDRSQMQLVREVIIRRDKTPSKLVIEVYAAEDCPLEIWSLENKKTLFESTFGVDLAIKRVVAG